VLFVILDLRVVMSSTGESTTASTAGVPPMSADPLTLAGHYLDDAVHGRNTEFLPRKQEAKLYALYKNPWMARAPYLAYAAYLALALFEDPGAPSASMLWPLWATALVEFACILVFIGRLFHGLLISVNAK